MKAKRLRQCLLTITLLTLWLQAVRLAVAAPLPQADDPAAQCAEGYRLFLDWQHIEALPLLEAGFSGRESATFDDLDDLGRCALALGVLRRNTGDPTGALEAYTVASGIFHANGNQEFEWQTLNNIGVTYQDQKHYAEALEAHDQALKIARELVDLAREGATLTYMGEVYHFQYRLAEALDAYQQALTNWREIGDPHEEQRTLSNIGNVYIVQEHYAEALDSYYQALTIQRRTGNRESEGTALNYIGKAYLAQGHYAEALDVYQQSLEIKRELDDRVGEATVLHGISMVYSYQGQYAEALKVAQQALQIVHEIGHRTGEGAVLNGIGLIYFLQGQYAKALEIDQQALAIRREVGDRLGEGATLSNIGGVYIAQGRYGEALGVFHQSLEIAQELGKRGSEGSVLHNIGVIYMHQGRYTKAMEAQQQALKTAREMGNMNSEVTTLNAIGLIYEHQGHYSEALDHYQQALSISREVGNQTIEGVVLNNIGSVYHHQARYTEALDHYQQALVIQRELGRRATEGIIMNGIGIIHSDQGYYTEALDTLQQALAIKREVGDRTGEGMTLRNIGMIYHEQGEFDQALAYYEQAMDVIESVRAVAGSETGRAGFIAQWADLYTYAIGLYHQRGQDARAFFTNERGRARAFLDSLTAGHVELSDDEAADLRSREQEAYATRQAARDALIRTRTFDPPDLTLIAELETQLEIAEEEYAAALNAIEAQGGRLAFLTPGQSTILDLPGVQALLDEQTTMLFYWILEDQTLAFLITHDDFHTIALDVGREDLATQITAFRSFPNLDVAHPESAVILYGWLIEPLREHLSTPHLAIVPHSVLHYLPFAALTDGQHHPMDDYVITYLPSASVLPFIQNNVDRNGGTFLILGNPATGDPDLRPLNYAEKEAEIIADLYNTRPLLAEDATESALQERSPRVGILHLAAHGSYNSYNPLYSAITLSPDEENDGRLEMHEIYGLNLANTDLVVLSACETQLGELSAGDELIGLTRAFFFAGTPSVVATLWSVDDRSMGLLMEHFYIYFSFR